MITETDALSTIEFDKYFVILPSFKPTWSIDEFKKVFNGKYCSQSFRYNSGENTNWLSVDELKKLIQEYVLV